MLDPAHALAAGLRPAGPEAPGTAGRQRALVLGAGGMLGTAVLEQLLASHRFDAVAALATQPIQTAIKGLVVVNNQENELRRFAPTTALMVFERERRSHGREVALLRPEPAQLAPWAARLLACGVRHLIVVVPHRASLLPMALQQGLANLDEAAVAALGFDQVVFMRMARAGEAGALDATMGRLGVADAARRLAHWMLSQLHWMVPQREQPVQALTVAKVAAALALHLPQAPKSTRVLPAQLLWQAAQQREVLTSVQAWLEGRPLPDPPAAAAGPRL